MDFRDCGGISGGLARAALAGLTAVLLLMLVGLLGVVGLGLWLWEVGR